MIKSKQDMVDRRLSECERSFQDGNLGSLLDALHYCEEYEQKLPEWIYTGLYELIIDAVYGGNIKKWGTKYKSDMIDYTRYDVINECIDNNLRWSDVYGAASTILENTIAKGGDEAMKKSYQRVLRNSKSNPGRYRICKHIQISGLTSGYVTEEVLEMANKDGRKKK